MSRAGKCKGGGGAGKGTTGVVYLYNEGAGTGTHVGGAQLCAIAVHTAFFCCKLSIVGYGLGIRSRIGLGSGEGMGTWRACVYMPTFYGMR